jgi:hypothetical protein
LLETAAHFTLQLSVQLLLLLQLYVGLPDAISELFVIVVEFPLFFLHFGEAFQIGDLHLCEHCVSVSQLLVLGLQHFFQLKHPFQ